MSGFDLSDAPENSRKSTTGGNSNAVWWRPDRNDEQSLAGVVMAGHMTSAYDYDELQNNETDVPVVTIAVAEAGSEEFSSKIDGNKTNITPENGMEVNLPTHARLMNELEGVEVGDALIIQCEGYYLPDGADNAQYVYEVAAIDAAQREELDFADELQAAEDAYTGQTGDDRVFYDSNGNPKGSTEAAQPAATDGGTQAAQPANNGPDQFGAFEDEPETDDVPDAVADAVDPARTFVTQIADDMACSTDELENFIQQTVGSDAELADVVDAADMYLDEDEGMVHAVEPSN